jgi:cell division GTPase FtsZ
MKPKDDPRSLDLCAIGLGQGGGNLAAEWRRRGYRAVIFNTAPSDTRALGHHEGLSFPEKLIFDIGLEGTEGAGKDPDYGMSCVRQHADDIRLAVEKNLRGADGILVCAGLGGGTGSAVPELLRVLEGLDLPLITVTTLPSGAESGIVKVNAVRSTNHLVNAELEGRLFIDNERLVEAFPEIDLVSYYPAVNARVFAPLDELNRLNKREQLWSIRSFDGEDLRKVLLSGGVLQTHISRLDADKPLDAEYLVDVVTTCVNGGNHLAQGLGLPDVAYLALVVVGPEHVLRNTPMQVFDDAVRAVKDRSGGGAVYEGLYVSSDDNAPLRAYVLSASLALPERITSLLGDAQIEGRELARKIQEDLPSLEISPLDGLELFRTPTKRPGGTRADRPAPPERRSLSDQLSSNMDELDVGHPREVSFSDEHEPENEFSAEKSGDLKPRVGSGQWDDDDEDLEPTRVAPADEVEAAAKKSRKKAKSSGTRAKTSTRSRSGSAEQGSKKGSKKAGDAKPRVGTGQYDDDDDAVRQEPTVFVPDDDDVLRRATAAYDRPNLPKEVLEAQRPPRRGLGVGLDETEALPPAAGKTPVAAAAKGPSKAPRAVTDRAALLPADSPVDFELGDDDVDFQTGFTDPGLEVREHKRLEPEDVFPSFDQDDLDDAVDVTRKDEMPSFPASLEDKVVSSLVEDSGTELQAVYEDLIDRYRQAPDRRGRDRVARRLKDDAQADDVEVRALAVWAMVKLEDPSLKRALEKSARDKNPEICKLAQTGLDRL